MKLANFISKLNLTLFEVALRNLMKKSRAFDELVKGTTGDFYG